MTAARDTVSTPADGSDELLPRSLWASPRGSSPLRPLLGWDELFYFNAPGTRDKRVAVSIYARLGLHPVLLHGLGATGRCTCGRDCGKSAGKHPVSTRWQTERLDLGRLERQLQQHWRYNIGLRMGPQPNGGYLVAIDVDGPLSLLDPLIAKVGPLPPTLTARTGGGGTHLLYWAPVPVRNRVGLVRSDAGQVDIRSRGGLIVVSPSRHRSGDYYTWANIRNPEVLPCSQ